MQPVRKIDPTRHIRRGDGLYQPRFHRQNAGPDRVIRLIVVARRRGVRRMRSLYQARMAATQDGLREAFSDILEIGPGDGGLQLAAWFHKTEADDAAAARFLHAHGICAMALSPFYLGEPRPGLLFGIAGATPERVAKLTAVMKSYTMAP